MEDRRKHPRRECALETSYSVKKIFSRKNYTVCRDISEHGIRIPCWGSIKENDLIGLDIDLKHGKPSFSTTARVVWTKKNKRPAPLDLEAGLEFTQTVSDAVKSFIAKL